MRTCDPFVYSLGVKCFVFSSKYLVRGCTQRMRKALLKNPKLMLVRRASAVCSFAYFCCCNGKCGAMCCSCRQGCAGACKGSSLCACAQCAVFWFLQYLRLVTAGSCEHLANCHARDHSSWDRRNRFCSQLLFGLALCGSDRNDFGCWDIPDRRLMYGAEVQSQQ